MTVQTINDTARTGASAVPTTLPSPSFSPNAVTVLEKRYLIKNDSGEPIETPTEMVWRVRSEERRVGEQCRYRWWPGH